MEPKGEIRGLEIRALRNVSPRSTPVGGGQSGNDDERIRFAIANKRLIKFMLYGLWRIAEPHDYGMRSGAPQLLVYQVRGESRSGRLPAWRWAVLGHASDFEVLEEAFPGSRNRALQHRLKWDKVFARVE